MDENLQYVYVPKLIQIHQFPCRVWNDQNPWKSKKNMKLLMKGSSVSMNRPSERPLSLGALKQNSGGVSENSLDGTGDVQIPSGYLT